MGFLNKHLTFCITTAVLVLTLLGCSRPILKQQLTPSVSDGQSQLDNLIRQWLGYETTTTTLEQINANFRKSLGSDHLNKKQFFEKLTAMIDSAPLGLEVKIDQTSNRMTVSLKNTLNYMIYDTFYFEFDHDDVFLKLKVVETIS